MRNEYVDMSELTRRIEEEIYDPEEYKLALAWVKENCSEGRIIIRSLFSLIENVKTVSGNGC